MTILHYSKAQPKTSSRIQLQQEFDKELSNGSFVETRFLKLLEKAFDNRRMRIIFHQRFTLLELYFTLIIKLILQYNWVIVYDLHDLSEINSRMSFFGKSLTNFHRFLEKILPRQIRVITVSEGLSQIFENDTGIQAKVVYNIPHQKNSIIESRYLQNKKNGRVVYFGQIKPDRISVQTINKLIKSKLILDIYGYFPPYTDSNYVNNIKHAVLRSGGDIKGPYKPNNLDFLFDYQYSLIFFDSSKLNIKYCMPNKLFQSIQYGLKCIISENLIEIRKTFEPLGLTVLLDEINNESDKVIDIDELIEKMKIKSFNNYKDSLSL